MIRNIVFDFGTVLVDWNPERLYRPYFNDEEKMRHFLTEICPYSWNTQADGGRSLAYITDERVAEFPEWEKEIRMYFDRWIDMMGDTTPGMYEYVSELKTRGYAVYGLTNWSAETFPLVRHRYPVFGLMEGIVVSGEERTVKPGPQIYHILMDRYGLKAEESVFIDDNPRNAAGAEAVGMRGLVFTSPEQIRQDLEKLLADG